MTALRTRLPLFIVLAAAAALIGAALLSGGAKEPPADGADPAARSAYWGERIRDEGARAAFAAFKEWNRASAREEQHLSAHLMGELIYESEGVAGVAVCDSEFGFGCYHGFMGRAISEGGEARVKELDAACVAAFGTLGTGCQHGIGHGILEYAGYDRIADALALCGATTEPAPLLGCASGVFMEYNTPLIGAGAGLTPGTRSTKEGLAAPCDASPEKYRPVCYYQLGQWLASVTDDGAAGKACAAAPAAHRARCFMGIGESVASLSLMRGAGGAGSCDAFGPEDALSCRAGVAWALFANQKGKEAARNACADPDPAKEARCIAFADLTGGLDPL